MAKEQKKFADDGWAIWIEGEDVSNVYLNDWLNPKGKSYVDIAIHIRGVKVSKSLHVYVPFAVTKEEVEDVSLFFQDKKFLQATFSVSCIVDYMKNQHTSEIAYNGKTVDIVHISTLEYKVSPLSEGTLIEVDLNKLQPYLDNDDAYFMWRMPHGSLDEIFHRHVNVGNVISRLRDLITTPVLSEQYGYSIRINEARRLPDEITKKGAFHRQKLNKAVVTISIDDSYELNDGACNLIRRLEEDLYQGYLPKGCKCSDVITYQWHQDQEYNAKGHFNFYYNIAKNSISRGSMFLYIVLLLAIGVAGELLADLVKVLIGWNP